MPLEMGKGLCGAGGAGIQYFPPPHLLAIILIFTAYPLWPPLCLALCCMLGPLARSQSQIGFHTITQTRAKSTPWPGSVREGTLELRSEGWMEIN